MVYEVDLDGKTLRIKSLDKPESPNKSDPTGEQSATTDPSKGEEARLEESETMENSIVSSSSGQNDRKDDGGDKGSSEPWPEHFTTELSPFLSEGAILQVKQMYLEGPEPPRVSDSGWGGRTNKSSEDTEVGNTEQASDAVMASNQDDKNNRGKDNRGGRGRRGGRAGGRGGGREDHRKVLSEVWSPTPLSILFSVYPFIQPITSKVTRTALHKAIRELFHGKLDSETDSTGPPSDEGSRIAIKWGRKGSGRGGNGRGVEPGNADQSDAVVAQKFTLILQVKVVHLEAFTLHTFISPFKKQIATPKMLWVIFLAFCTSALRICRSQERKTNVALLSNEFHSSAIIKQSKMFGDLQMESIIENLHEKS